MKKQQVFHYTDFKSPFAYLAKDPTYKLEEDFDIDVIWRPYTLNIPSFLGTVEDRSEAQWRKVKYAYMDMRRFANKRGLTVKGPRRIYNSTPASIGMLYAQDKGVFHAYNDTIFYRFWNHILEVDDVDAIEAVLTEAGADASGYRDFLKGDGRQRHDSILLEAERQGVFGVPTYVFNDEVFWGHDRIDLLREKLTEHFRQ